MPAGRPQAVFVQSQFMDPAPPECEGLVPQRDQDRWSHITPGLQALSLKHGLSDFCDAELRPDLNNAIFVSD